MCIDPSKSIFHDPFYNRVGSEGDNVDIEIARAEQMTAFNPLHIW